MDNRLILASASPRRDELLKTLAIPFEVVPSLVEETRVDGESPSQAAIRLAELKAREVRGRYPGRIILAADTIVVLDGQMLGKPKDIGDAREMLSRLSGRLHVVITGFCLIDGSSDREIARAVATEVKMKRISAAELEGYLSSGEPLDKAGAYAIQGTGAFLVEAITGSYSNVVGLPLAEVCEELKQLGVYPFADRGGHC
ncbi:MAG: Maf family protein [Thermodesulfobacteriota bacterium]